MAGAVALTSVKLRRDSIARALCRCSLMASDWYKWAISMLSAVPLDAAVMRAMRLKTVWAVWAPATEGFGNHRQQLESVRFTPLGRAAVGQLETLVFLGGCKCRSRRHGDILCLQRRRDCEVKGCWQAPRPRRQEEVSRSTARVVFEEAFFFAFNTQSCGLCPHHTTIAQVVVPAGPVAASGTCHGVRSGHIQDAVALWTPFIAVRRVQPQPQAHSS